MYEFPVNENALIDELDDSGPLPLTLIGQYGNHRNLLSTEVLAEPLLMFVRFGKISRLPTKAKMSR